MLFQTCGTQKKIFWRIWVTKKLMGRIDFHSMDENNVGPINCLVTHILKNIYFVFSRRKKVLQVWNNLKVSKWWLSLNVKVNVKQMGFLCLSLISSSRRHKVYGSKLENRTRGPDTAHPFPWAGGCFNLWGIWSPFPSVQVGMLAVYASFHCYYKPFKQLVLANWQLIPVRISLKRIGTDCYWFSRWEAIYLSPGFAIAYIQQTTVFLAANPSGSRLWPIFICFPEFHQCQQF